LEFSRWILVYLYEDVNDMESRPKQIRNQTGPFVLPNPRRGKNLNGLFTLPAYGSESRRPMGLIRVVRTLPCPEVMEERNRMAGEIHDTLAQQFAGIFLNLEAAIRLDTAQQQSISEYLARAKDLAKNGLEDARRMLLGLRPKSLEGTQLCDALKELAQNFSRDFGIECSFCLRGRAHRIPQNAQNELYRVAQEALCNVRKHSGARSVSILLRYGSGGVLLAIIDDGQGFVVKKSEAGAQGFGLPTMGERANRLGGKMDINTRLGTGTEIRISVPLPGNTSKGRNSQ
jgi:signal transduction histidine kinase